MTNKLSILSDELLANLFLQLSRMEIAGFPAQQAFELLEKTGSNHHRCLKQLQQYLKAGKSISEAGFMAGVFNCIDSTLLAAGESSG